MPASTVEFRVGAYVSDILADSLNGDANSDASLLERIPERYLQSLRRTEVIAETVGTELPIRSVSSVYGIAPEPGMYVFGEQDSPREHDIKATRFTLEPQLLSGKIDSAHSVLPGTLSFLYIRNNRFAERHLNVAAKGYYKRNFADKFERIAAEVRTSHCQRARNEFVYDPIAVIIAPPEYKGKGTDEDDYDMLLLTKLNESATSLDNVPWTLGFQKSNLEAAEQAVHALGRFNTTIGCQGDAKIKNFIQCPSGKTSMIDFETFAGIDWEDSLSVATAVHVDLGKFLDSLMDLGFFAATPHRAREVADRLGQSYLEHWGSFGPDIQESVYEATVEVIERCLSK
ncbi:MAG TPA: hypothetical protein VFN51_02395 [Candidatus Saccharimonadales bacterium]|nr:hypothetical protein [Candidatus Saccharimonadales bacterium]